MPAPVFSCALSCRQQHYVAADSHNREGEKKEQPYESLSHDDQSLHQGSLRALELGVLLPLPLERVENE
jgi:hypothetical protein